MAAWMSSGEVSTALSLKLTALTRLRNPVASNVRVTRLRSRLFGAFWSLV
jgi:hypothetical protein